MPSEQTLEQQVDALERGVGVLDLTSWHVVRVTGADAEGWLDDLVTAGVRALSVGGSVRSFLLGPTGRIRAEFLVHRTRDHPVLLQSPGQPRSIDDLLGPYVLSSDVMLEPMQDPLAILPVPGPRWTVTTLPPDGAVTVELPALDSWRIGLGAARFPDDLDEDSVPAEAGLDVSPIVDRVKGCYLGQESVARIRNLGHPARLIVAVEAADPLVAGLAVVAEAGTVGVLTSVDPGFGRRKALARIRWGARDSALATDDGVALTRR